MRMLGGGALTLVVLAVIVLVAAVPLLFVVQSTCGRGDQEEHRYSFVLPWDDAPSECREPRRGYEVLGDAIGL
jgi:hypothetical protein